MAGGDVEAPGRGGGGGGGAGARVVAAHLAAASLGLVAVVCSGTWCWGVLPEGADDAMYYLFTAAVMQFGYNVGWFFQKVKALFAGGSRRSFAPAEYAVELHLRVCIMYVAFGGGVVGACLASGFGGVFSIRNLGRYNWSAAALDAAVVCIFFAWAVNQIAFVHPPLDVAATAVQGKISAHPEGARPSIDQLCWVERVQLSSKAIGFWKEHAPDELQTGGGQPRSAGKSPSRQATFD